MVTQSSEVDTIFRALADATRRDIVRRTLVERQSVSALAERYDMSFAAVHKHVAVLERAQLVTKHRVGREALVCGNFAAVSKASALLAELEALWRGRIDRMGEMLANPKSNTSGEQT